MITVSGKEERKGDKNKDRLAYVGIGINFLAFVLFIGLSFLGALGFFMGLLFMLAVWGFVWWHLQVPRNVFGTIVPTGTYKVLTKFGKPYRVLDNTSKAPARLFGAIYFFIWPIYKVQMVRRIDLDSTDGEDNNCIVDFLPGYPLTFTVKVEGCEVVGNMQVGFDFSLRGHNSDPLTRVQVKRWKGILFDTIKPVIRRVAAGFDYYGSSADQNKVLAQMEQEILKLIPSLNDLVGMELETLGVLNVVAPAEVDQANADERRAKAEAKRLVTLAKAEADVTTTRATGDAEALKLKGQGRAAGLLAEVEVVKSGGDAAKAVLVAEAVRTSPVGLAMAANLLNVTGIGEGNGLTVKVDSKDPTSW